MDPANPDLPSSAPDAVVRVEHFGKAYDKRLAVDDLSFSVKGGEILGLVGPNGAGKTTTLRALAGILQPSSGSLSIDGFDVAKQPLEAKRRLAMVPDEPHLFASLTVWEHLEFTAQVYQVAGFESRGTRLLEELELLDRRDTVADELSRGMRQKTALACALLHEPKALLMDEPLTGLDPRGIRTLYTTLRRRAESGAAVVLSTHLLGQIEGLCTTFLILRAGRGLFCGTMAQIRAQLPALSETASLEDVFFQATEGSVPHEPAR
ncbi:MAG: ABC transporter ATP-binding protein [Planctomycetes bacterium]|nr:ABC transporter ATP-binding protein [Planctomycetota bacterium]